MIGKSKNQIRQRALEAIREQQQKAQMQAILLGSVAIPQYMDPEDVMQLRERETQNREGIERARREDHEREIMAQITENAARNLNMDWGINGARDMPDQYVRVYGSLGSMSIQQQLEQDLEARREAQRNARERQNALHQQTREALRSLYSGNIWWDEPAQEQMQQQEEPEPVIVPKPRPEVKVIRGPRRIRI